MSSARSDAPDLPDHLMTGCAAAAPARAAGRAGDLSARSPQAGALRRFALALRDLVDSAEPAVVFTALARLCVPALCDGCAVVIIEEQMPGYRIEFPAPAPTGDLVAMPPADDMVRSAASERTLSIPIHVWPTDRGRDYRGVLTCLWCDGHEPTDAEAALVHLAVDRAIRTVHRARLIAAVQSAETKAANLQIALASNRDIGVAIGIVMGRHLITREAAFDLLRAASQHSHRKLRDIAKQMIATGELPPFTSDPRTGGSTRGPLRAVPEAETS